MNDFDREIAILEQYDPWRDIKNGKKVALYKQTVNSLASLVSKKTAENIKKLHESDKKSLANVDKFLSKIEYEHSEPKKIENKQEGRVSYEFNFDFPQKRCSFGNDFSVEIKDDGVGYLINWVDESPGSSIGKHVVSLNKSCGVDEAIELLADYISKL